MRLPTGRCEGVPAKLRGLRPGPDGLSPLLKSGRLEGAVNLKLPPWGLPCTLGLSEKVRGVQPGHACRGVVRFLVLSGGLPLSFGAICWRVRLSAGW